MISNANLRVVLEKNLPFRRLEDAAVPVHVVTTELRTGRAVLMSSGPAVPALLASTAIPGIFPPVTIGRREFIAVKRFWQPTAGEQQPGRQPGFWRCTTPRRAERLVEP